MGLLNLKTDLKSLKYGNDRKGGGSSNQPYIVTPIPEEITPSSPDFLLRNTNLIDFNDPVAGLRARGAISDFISLPSIVDSERLLKYFIDTKNISGFAFIAKQQLLARQNPDNEILGSVLYNPASTVAQAGVGAFGYHLNKDGLNPTARGYYQNGASSQGYFKKTLNQTADGLNRLELLFDTKQLYSEARADRKDGRRNFDIAKNPDLLFNYFGGPNALLGLGRTTIRIAGSGYGLPDERTNNDTNKASQIETYLRFGNAFPSGSVNYNKVQNNNLPTQREKNSSTLLSSLNPSYNPNIKSFNRETTYGTTTVPEYPSSASTAYNDNPNQSLSVDFINKYGFINRTANDQRETIRIQELQNSDLIKFYFEHISNTGGVNGNDNNFIFFRAYINDIGDNFKGEWSDYKYVGRAEKFYKYSGFTRTINLDFSVYAHSRKEIWHIYNKMNYMIGLTAPYYSSAGLMQGKFTKLTVGDWFIDEPVIVTDVSLKPSLEAGWDINRTKDGKPIPYYTGEFTEYNDENIDYAQANTSEEWTGQVPRLVDMQLSIIPLHTFAPQYGFKFIRNNSNLTKPVYTGIAAPENVSF
jgi:hypothetical protein